MNTPPRPTRIPEGTPEKGEKKPRVVIVGPHPLCSAFLPEDYVEQCGRPADVHVLLPNGEAPPGLAFCLRCFSRPDIAAAYDGWPRVSLR